MKIRIARPSTNLEKVKNFYCEILGFKLLGSFENHEGFDGIMIGHPKSNYHLEFTYNKFHQIQLQTTEEDHLVFYISNKSDWVKLTNQIESKGISPIGSSYPYWDRNGKTYKDPDGGHEQRSELIFIDFMLDS